MFKVYILILGLLFVAKSTAMFTSSMNDIQVVDTQTTGDYGDINVDWIDADAQQNLIKIYCSLSKRSLIDSIISGHVKIQVDTRKKEENTLHAMYVKDIELHAENTVIIIVQPLLKAAIYGDEKRDFMIRFTEGETTIEILKTVVLSTSIQLLDLRSYTTSDFLRNFRSSVSIILFFTVLLILAVPIIRKYNFKKYHVKKYRQITYEDKAKLDPFTFESIEEHDQVVVIDKKIILLRSWKRLRAMAPELRTERLNIFFSEDDEKSHLFKPLTYVGKNVNRVWFGMIGAYVTWLLYTYLMQYDIEVYQKILSSFFDNKSEQFSTIIYGDTLLAALFGIIVGMAFILAERFYAKHSFSAVKAIFRWIFGSLFLIAFFGLQSYLNIYKIDDTMLGEAIKWLSIGTGMAIAFGMHLHIKKIIIMIPLLAIAGFGVYQLSTLNIALNTYNTQILFLFNLLILGSIAGGLSYRHIVLVQKALHGKPPDLVEEKNNTMTVQVH